MGKKSRAKAKAKRFGEKLGARDRLGQHVWSGQCIFGGV